LAGSVAIAQVATGPAKNITSEQNRVNTRGSMSLDGKKIAYTYPAHNNYDSGAIGSNQVWVMNSDGTGKKQVEWSISSDLDNTTVAYEWPSLNADGTKLVMHVWDTGNSTDLVLVDLVAGTTTRLTNNTVYDAYPAFSPDGTKIVFLSKRDDADNYQIYVMNAAPESAANVPVKLTTGLIGAKYARFTPDGKSIIFGGKSPSLNPDNYQVLSMSATDGSNLHLVTSATGYDANEPSQMTAGGRIYFVANYTPDGKRRVYSCLPDGSDIRQVSAGSTVQYGASDGGNEEYFAFAAGNKLMTTFADLTLGDISGVGSETAFFNADIHTYDLATASGNGTLSGTIQVAPGTPAVSASVQVFDGVNNVASLSTDAQGKFSTPLPAGGYTIEISYEGAPVYYGAVVTSGATSTRTTYVDDANVARPLSVLPTIAGGNVDIRWTAAADSNSATVTGYNVYRSAAENGPWTKLNSTLIAQGYMPTFLDTTPGDLTSAFYAVTTVAFDGSTTYESAPSDIAQAANNLVFNPSFEITGSDGLPLGWKLTSWGNNATVGIDTQDKALGSQSAYQQAGTNTSAMSFIDTKPPYSVPSAPGDKFINGMYAHSVSSTGGAYISQLFAFSTDDPDSGAIAFYSWGDATMRAFNDSDHPWSWVGGWWTINTEDEATYTRVSCTYGNGGNDGATAGVSRAYYDEIRMQLRRVGATGVIVGRTLEPDGSAVTGVTVSTPSGLTATSGTGGIFVLRNVPTGTVSLTATIAGYTTTQSVLNVGGARPDIVMPVLPALTISGTVYYSDGSTPAPNAAVMLAYADGTVSAPKIQKTTADSSGHYSFASPTMGDGDTAISASLPQYAEGVTARTLGVYGPATVDVTLGDLAPVVSVVRTSTPPTIDGVVNASEWGASQAVPVNFGSTSTIVTTAYMLWDDSALYVAFVGDEPNPSGILAAASFEDDSLIWWTGTSWNADDNYGVWLDANRNAGAGYGYEQLQMLFNANLTSPSIADIAWRNYIPYEWGAAWTSGTVWKANVDTTKKTFSVEMKIPYAGMAYNSLGAPTVTAGSYWRGRLTRHRNQPITDTTTGDGGMDWTSTSTSWNTFQFVTSLPAKGDVNRDGSIDTTDVALALKIAAGLQSGEGYEATGDVNGDGKVSLEDALKILRKVTGVAPTL
jgi:Tol biopolymer transport system component